MEPIYLDNNATTRCDPAVVEAMLPFFTEHFGNASSIHAFGSEVGKALKKARSQVQALLGAEHDSEIIFTSCGTESDCDGHPLGAEGAAGAQHGDHHQRRAPGDPDALRVAGEGRLHRPQAQGGQEGPPRPWTSTSSLLNDRVAIVSAMWANNETGTLFPVLEMAAMAAAKGSCSIPTPCRRSARSRSI
jgi:cysteine desulfurase